MNRTKALLALKRVHKTVSLVLVLKSAMGVSLLALALFGITVPHLAFLGIEPSFASEGAAAGAGAVIGSLLALKA